MQVDNTIQNKPQIPDSDNSVPKESNCAENKQSRAENRIARYEQKPERKASKMLVRLLQWADKLVIKFFTKKLLPHELEIFFNRQARANKVELKKAQIDYSVQDFAVRLYVFWVCHNYFQKANFQQNLNKLLLELRDQLNRKKKNLSESFQMCEQQTQKRQKEEELKWMGAIITGLTTFIGRYKALCNEEETLEFLLEITSNIMIDCLRKPGNKLGKKKDKLKTKIKYFQQKMAQVLDNPEIKVAVQQKQKKTTKLIQKNTIIISPGLFPLEGLARTSSSSSAFQKYKADDSLGMLRESIVKKEDFQVRLDNPKRSDITKLQFANPYNEVIKSCEKITILKEPIIPLTSPASQVKMQVQPESHSQQQKSSSSEQGNA